VVARTLAARYRNRGIDLEALERVACLALTKAAHRFDPNAGYDFLAYAVPTMRGELRRHFRDYGWTIRPPRTVQDLQRRIMSAHDELTMKLGRSPRPSDLAAHLEVDLAKVEEALAADGCFRPASLDWPAGEGAMTVGDFVIRVTVSSRQPRPASCLNPCWASCAHATVASCNCASSKNAPSNRLLRMSDSPRLRCRASSFASFATCAACSTPKTGMTRPTTHRAA
jgi:hypothetical protein